MTLAEITTEVGNLVSQNKALAIGVLLLGVGTALPFALAKGAIGKVTGTIRSLGGARGRG